MNKFIKDNWIVIVWMGILLLVPVYFVSNFLITKYQSKNIVESTDETVREKFPSAPWGDVEGEVAKAYGNSFLKTTDYSLSDVVEKEGLEKPYIVKAGAFNFSFSSVGGDSWDIPTTFFNDFKIYENDALVLGSGNDDGSWVIGISNVNYKNKSYYMVETYSGGAHCCIDRYPIVISGESIKMNKTIDTGDVGGMGFFEKDGEVYVWMVNTDFSYFLISYSASSIMTYPNFYKFDKNTGVLIQVDEEFEEYYKKFINTQTAVIEQFKTSNYSKDAGDIWPAFLSARAVYQLKAGQDRGDVMKQFDADFKILDAKYPRSGSSDGKLEEIKSDILKRVFP